MAPPAAEAADAAAPPASPHRAGLLAAKAWYLWVYSAQALLLPFLNLFFLRAGLSQTQVGSLMALRPWVSAVTGARGRVGSGDGKGEGGGKKCALPG